MRRILWAGLFLSCMIVNAQNMDNALTPRRKGLAVIAALEAKGDQVGLEKAIADALDNGLTISEAKEALSQLYAYTGFPRSLNALGTLQRVLAQREAAGIQDAPGKEADPLPEDYDALKQGTAVQTQLSGQPFNYSFAPATDYYLKAHLFGDIFARNNLSYARLRGTEYGRIRCGAPCFAGTIGRKSRARRSRKAPRGAQGCSLSELFFVSLCSVKLFVLILSFLLSFLSAGRTEVVFSEHPSTEEVSDFTQNREICITSAQGSTFAGNNSTNSVSVRLTQSLRRLNQPVRSTFRIVKGGKVMNIEVIPYKYTK